jgi:hypothetical protein
MRPYLSASVSSMEHQAQLGVETTSDYMHFPEEFRSKVAKAAGLFLEGRWSQWSPLSGISRRRTCHVTCSRMKGLTIVGEWLSLVEHLVRDQGVGGSNPLSPTKYFAINQLRCL